MVQSQLSDHEGVWELLGAYALGAADQHERKAVENHLDVCANCRARLSEYRALTERMQYAIPPRTAAPRLATSLQARVAPVAQRDPPPTGWLLWLRRPSFALGSLALLLIVLVATNLYWVDRLNALDQRTTALARLTAATPIALRSEGAGSEGSGALYLYDDAHLALLCVYGLPRLPKDRTYQVWLLKGQQRENGGLLRVNGDGFGVLLIQSSSGLKTYSGLGVTVEPAGGSPGPTSPRVIGVTL